VFGEQSGPVHIVIRATADSWLQVRDGDENLVAQRLLHAGDTYRVPDKPGLVMRTGNGSGLEITVDGRPAPRLGGAIRRNVALDPAKLLAGTAAE
jgi:cytoskeleton protein RodZ